MRGWIIALATMAAGCSITADESAAYPVGPYALKQGGILPDLAGPGVDPASGRGDVRISNVRAALRECRCMIVHVGAAGSELTLDAREKLRDLRLSDPTTCAVEIVAASAIVALPQQSEAVAPTMLAPRAVQEAMPALGSEGFDLAVRTDKMDVRLVANGAMDVNALRSACGTWPRHSSD
jgi:hypothetical protein